MVFTFENYLFPALKLTKTTDIDKCKYSGYGIGFDSRRTFLFPSGKFAKNVIILVLIWVLLYMLITRKKKIF